MAALHVPEPLSGLDAELIDEGAPRLAVDSQRLGLAVGAIKREHELCSEPLAKWVRGHERLQIADDLPVSPEREVRLQALLECGQAEVLEPGRLDPGKIGFDDVGQSGPTPECERLSERERGGFDVALRR